MEEVTLEAAGPEQIAGITELAHLVWNQHYPAIIGRAQIDYMLGRMYSETSLLEQMSIKDHRFFFILAGGRRSGFLSWSRDTDGACFIHKFYIDQRVARRGIGTAALSALRGVAATTTFRLTVNRQNYKAINFYFRNGFVIERVADFDIGGGFVMNDFVMAAGIRENSGKNHAVPATGKNS